MKRFFKFGSIVLLCFVFNVPGTALEEKHHNNLEFVSSASDHQFILAEASGSVYDGINRNDEQHSIPRLYPTSQKHPLGAPDIWSNKNNEISVTVIFAENHIVRLDGPDIIHPFHYFW